LEIATDNTKCTSKDQVEIIKMVSGIIKNVFGGGFLRDAMKGCLFPTPVSVIPIIPSWNSFQVISRNLNAKLDLYDSLSITRTNNPPYDYKASKTDLPQKYLLAHYISDFTFEIPTVGSVRVCDIKVNLVSPTLFNPYLTRKHINIPSIKENHNRVFLDRMYQSYKLASTRVSSISQGSYKLLIDVLEGIVTYYIKEKDAGKILNYVNEIERGLIMGRGKDSRLVEFREKFIRWLMSRGTEQVDLNIGGSTIRLGEGIFNSFIIDMYQCENYISEWINWLKPVPPSSSFRKSDRLDDFLRINDDFFSEFLPFISNLVKDGKNAQLYYVDLGVNGFNLENIPPELLANLNALPDFKALGMTLTLGLEFKKGYVTTDYIYTILISLLAQGGMFIIKRPDTGKIIGAIHRVGIVKVDEIDSSLTYSNEFYIGSDGKPYEFREAWIDIALKINWGSLYGRNFLTLMNELKNSFFDQLAQTYANDLIN